MVVDSIVVVPWDFSEHSQSALDFALKQNLPQNIRVICVLERPSPYAAQMLWGDDAEQTACKKCAEQFFEVVDKSKYPGLEFVAEFGDPAAVIVRFAKQLEAGVIVISTHGRTGIKRLMLGSVAQKVAQSAACPVMLLPNAWFEAEKKRMSGGVSAASS